MQQFIVHSRSTKVNVYATGWRQMTSYICRWCHTRRADWFIIHNVPFLMNSAKMREKDSVLGEEDSVQGDEDSVQGTSYI